MTWLNKLLPGVKKNNNKDRRSVPAGVWTNCPKCSGVLFQPELENSLFVCPKCGEHLQMGARQRLLSFLDESPAPQELAPKMKSVDFLKFRDISKYKERLQKARKQSNETDAFIAMSGHLDGEPVVAGAFEFSFMGGSMSSAVGERFVRAVGEAVSSNVPMVCFCSSGGARMQEGLISLMQMAKTTMALEQLHAKNLPYVTVLTNPTMGGVSASLAMQGDLIISEPNALVGFAGPRVIRQTVREELPEGFQRSETLLRQGAIDSIIKRTDQRRRIASMLSILMAGQQSSTRLMPVAATSD